MAGGDLWGRRRRELKVLGWVTVGIALTAPFVAVLLDRAWATDALLRGSVDAVRGLVGVSIGPTVVFATGVIVGWMLLIPLDRSKRLQAPALGLLAAALVAALVALGRLRIVDWTGNVPALLAGMLLAVAVGVATALLVDRLEFPGAALGLYTVALLLAGFGLVDAYLVGGWFRPDEAATALGYAVAVATVPATLSFVALVGYFVRYRDQRTVAIVRPNDGDTAGCATAVVTGLTQHVQGNFKSNVFAGGGTTANAPESIVQGERPAPLAETVGVTFRSPQLVSRWIEVKAMPTDPEELIDEEPSESGIGRRIAEVMFGPYVELLDADRGSPASASGVRGADVVVFVVSAEDFVPAGTDGNVGATDLEAPAFLDSMAELSRTLGRDTHRVLALYEGDIGRDVYENDVDATGEVRMNDPDVLEMFETYAVPMAFRVDSIVALASNEGDEPLVAGSPRLRRELLQ